MWKILSCILYSANLYLIINPIYVMRYHGINKNYQAMIRSFHVPIRKLSECSNFFKHLWLLWEKIRFDVFLLGFPFMEISKNIWDYQFLCLSVFQGQLVCAANLSFCSLSEQSCCCSHIEFLWVCFSPFS